MRYGGEQPQAEDGPRIVHVRPGARLPSICVQCGQPTHRQVKHRAVGPRPPSREIPKSGVERALGCMPQVGCLFSLGFLLYRRAQARGGSPPVVAVRLPHCAECDRRGRPPVVGAHFAQHTLVVEAHPRFADALEAKPRSRSRLGDVPRGEERSSPRRGR